MGGKCVATMERAGVIPKNRKIATLRRSAPVKLNGATIIPTYDPHIIHRDRARYQDILWDTTRAYRLHTTGSIDPVLGEYTEIASIKEAVDEIKLAILAEGRPLPVVLDLETVGVDPYKPGVWIVSLGLSWKPGEAVVRYFSGTDELTTSEWVEVRWLLTHPGVKLRGANLKFDLSWIRQRWKLRCTNFSMDSTVVGSLLDENRSNSLNGHTKWYVPSLGGYDDGFNLKYDKGRMDLVPRADVVVYNGGDCDAALQVSNAQVASLARDRKLRDFYVHLLHPACRALEKMERTGIHLDLDYCQELHQQFEHDMGQIEDDVYDMLPRSLQLKWAGEYGLTKARVKTDFLFGPKGLGLTPLMLTEKAEEPSTAKEHFDLLMEEYPESKPFIEACQAFDALKKTDATYVTGFLNCLKSDGLLHPTAMPYKGDFEGSSDKAGEESGTVTGRLAFKDPAVQTIPKHTRWAKALRRAYLAPPGYVVVNWDYSQGELKITACLANEPTMLASYKKGFDLHAVTGAEVNGLTFEQAMKLKEVSPAQFASIRQGGKAGNFGLIYGMQARGFQHYARVQYGVEKTFEEAQAFRNSFFGLYPRLGTWHDNATSFARRHKGIRSPLGRIRHLPLILSPDYDARSRAERQAINSPVQSTLSDLALWALARFDQTYSVNEDWPEGCKFFLTTHDAITAYVKEDELHLWVPRVTEIMETLPIEATFGWRPQLDFTTDCEVGPNLADLKGVEEYALAA